MLDEKSLLAQTLLSFLLVLTRTSGAMALIPLAGWRRAPDPARIVFALSLTIALCPVWPKPPTSNPSLGQMMSWLFPELGVGLAIGLAAGLLIESFMIAAQVIGMQAGYSYASTIDPSSEADSGVLQVITQLMAGLLFFAFRLDTELVRALAVSYQKYPVGALSQSWGQMDTMLLMGTEMWKTAVRLAIPVVFLLMMLDLSLALLGRIQAQLQLLTMAFPIKMLTTLVALAALAGTFPFLFREQADKFVTWLR
jgi:flagellar biosynthetic protein FliR